jgi:hypothetical protein
MEYLQWIVLIGLIAWGFRAAVKRPPPSPRWKDFAESNGLELQPSTPFASARIRGLWRQGSSGSPIPIEIQILRRSRTGPGGVRLRTRVPCGLPWGLCLDSTVLAEPYDDHMTQGIRSRELAHRIRTNHLSRPLSRFFEDWPEARILQGGIQLYLRGRVNDIQEPVEAMVELCRILESGASRTPSDLVIAETLPEDIETPGTLLSATITAEEQALEDSVQDAMALQNWTPFGSPFGLKAPDMTPPKGVPSTAPLPLDAEWALPEPSPDVLRQLKSLASSQDPEEKRALLRQLERHPVSLSQDVRDTTPSAGVFLPPPWRGGVSTTGALRGVDIAARLLHPRGLKGDPADCPWPVQIVDWDPRNQCLVGHRLIPSSLEAFTE